MVCRMYAMKRPLGSNLSLRKHVTVTGRGCTVLVEVLLACHTKVRPQLLRCQESAKNAGRVRLEKLSAWSAPFVGIEASWLVHIDGDHSPSTILCAASNSYSFYFPSLPPPEYDDDGDDNDGDNDDNDDAQDLQKMMWKWVPVC